MPLTSGHRIGQYEVLGPAGTGGMGEVYRARDSRLERTVAIKALPAGLAASSERLARFEQEARLLASLNHPNIAGIHGIEDATGDDTGGPYLVLEFVEGETLAQKLAGGPLSVTETVQLGTQITAAVDAAHEKGIIHRDLKPGNIMIDASNTVKILDFGLAKDHTQQAEASSPDLAASPTLATPATAEGMVLGTAPYMSPEQARGRPVDRRADVWAFGCILMECLTGRQTFPGDTPSDVIAKILEREPEWDQLPPGTPPRLLDIIRRCLTKDPSLRPRDIGDIGRELKALGSDSTSRPMKAAEDVPSLAVLYFENLARDPDSEYFCSGITEDILTDLSKIKGLRVASKNAVSRYRGTEVDLSRIAMDLGVQSVLEGSVRRAGDRIRITVQLINAADGFQLWAERFDRTLDDVFAVQDEIATAIVEALRVAMSPSDIQEIARDRPADVKAYDLYLKGREKYGLYTKEAMQEALDLFNEAIALEPEYALAWAGVADCYGQFLQYEWSEDPKETHRLGLEAALKASSIDPKLPDAYKAEANVRSSTFADDSEGARRALTRAIQADPTYTPAQINMAVSEFLDGNLAGAERLVRRVLEIDPQEKFAMLWLVWLLYWTHRQEEAVTVARRVRELAETDFYLSGAYTSELRSLVLLGNLDEAETILATALADDRVDSDQLIPVKGLVAAHRGRTEEARESVRQASKMSWNNVPTLPIIVDTAFRIGEPDLARATMEAAVEKRFVPMVMRLEHVCHPLLDREPFSPRRLVMTLVWPLQTPVMIDEARFALFKEVRIESGRPEGTDILGSES